MNLLYDEKDEDKKLKENFIEKFSKYLYEERKKYFEIVFLCIGTDRIIGDCLGPLVGTILQEKLEKYNIVNINIYGNLKENICYTNIQNILKRINQKHKNACIIVIDAALSHEDNIGKIFISKEKMILGKGLHKEKVEIGDISIKAVVGKDYKFSKYNFSSLQNISLNVVIRLAELIADGIYEVIKYV